MLFAMLPVSGLALDRAERLIEGLRALPWAMHGLVALALVTGLLLWALGRRVLKPSVVALAALAAGVAGFVVVPTVAPDAGVSPYVGALGGLAVGVVAGMLLYRLALAATFGVVMAVAAAVVTAAAVGAGGVGAVAGLGEAPLPKDLGPTAAKVEGAAAPAGGAPDLDANLSDGPASEDPVRERPAGETATDGAAKDGAQLVRQAQDAAAAAREFASALWARAGSWWGERTRVEKLAVGGAGVLGLALGALLGLTLPAWAAGAVTALAGAAVWLPAAVWLAHALGAPPAVLEQTNLSPTGWAVVWAAVSALGVAVQWLGLMKGRRAAKPAGEKAT